MTGLVTLQYGSFSCYSSRVPHGGSWRKAFECTCFECTNTGPGPPALPSWVSTRQCSAHGWPSHLLILLALPPEPLPRLLTKHKCRSAHPLQLAFNTEAFVSCSCLFCKCSQGWRRGDRVPIQGQVAGRCCHGLRDTAVVQLQRLQCSPFSAFVHGCLGVWTSGCPAHGPLWFFCLWSSLGRVKSLSYDRRWPRMGIG